jgi:hypothetical protein
MTSDPENNGHSDALDLGAEFADIDLDEFEDEYEDLVEALGLPERMPPLSLPPLAELAAAARESVLMRRIGELVAWVGERREVDENGDLTEPASAEAEERLGLTRVELLLCWEIALETDLVVVSEDDDTADANPDLWPTGDDHEDLATWSIAFSQTLQSLIIDTEVASEYELEFDSAGALVLPLFLARGLGVPVAELQQISQEVETEDLEDERAWYEWVDEHGHPVTTLLGRLTEHGAVEVDEEGVARLTPLGMLVMRDQLVEGGVEIPLLPPPAEMTAADLLTVIGGVTSDELTELSDEWLVGRDPKTAATELLAAAAVATPEGRFYATSILGRIPETPWPTVLDEPALRAYARGALSQAQEPADTAWLLLDAISASVNVLGELDPEVVEGMAVDVLSGREPEVLDAAWRLQHPMAHEVLTLIGAHHPDKKIAKLARTAAHKAESAATP